jgi:hypothetical protein
MQIYYPNLEAIQQKTSQLEYDHCIHCGSDQLVSHGYVYRKDSVKTTPTPVGKRVFCSNRYWRTGCGRTMQLYLDPMVRYLHYAGCCVVAFVLLLVAGNTISSSYQGATGTADPRNAYRWLNKLSARLSDYRSLFHQPQFDGEDPAQNPVVVHPRWRLLASTFRALLARFGEPLCGNYQRALQTSFL